MSVPLAEIPELWGKVGKWFLDNVSDNLQTLVDPPPGASVVSGATDFLALALTGHIKVTYAVLDTVAYLTVGTVDQLRVESGPFYTAGEAGVRTLVVSDLRYPGADVSVPATAVVPASDVFLAKFEEKDDPKSAHVSATTLLHGEDRFHLEVLVGSAKKETFHGTVQVLDANGVEVEKPIPVSIVL